MLLSSQRLQVALLALFATYQGGQCHMPCPLQCVDSFAVPTDRGVRWIGGPAAKNVADVIKEISETRPSSPLDKITIEGEKVPVPTKVKPKVLNVLKTYPELSPVILDMLRPRRPFSPGSHVGPSETPDNSKQPSGSFETFGPQQFGAPESEPSEPVGPQNTGPFGVGHKKRPGQRNPESPTSWIPNIFGPDSVEPSNFQPAEPGGSFGTDFLGPKHPKPRGPEEPLEHGPRPVTPSASEEPELNEESMEPSRPKDSETPNFEPGEPSNPGNSDQSSPETSLPSNTLDNPQFSPEEENPDSPTQSQPHRPGQNKPQEHNPKGPEFSRPDGFQPSSPEDSKPSFPKSKHFPSFQPSNFEPSNPFDEFPSSDSEHRPSHPVKELPTADLNEESPEVSLPGVVKIPHKDKTVPGDVRSYLDFLEKNPNLFVPIYKTLVNKGVKFPDLSKPFQHVTLHGKHIHLPRKVAPSFTIKINGRTFTLPRDADELATFTSEHPDQLPAITTAIRQLGGDVTPDATGKVPGFTLFDKKTPLPQPVAPTVVVNGRPFTLPKDLPALVRDVQDKPEVFHKILPILEEFGVRTEKSPSGEIKTIRFGGRSFPVRSVSPVPIIIRGRVYNIPADLERILANPDSQIIGEIISALQKSKIPVVVDKDSGNVVGIEKDGVTIPFPVAIRLGIKLGGRDFLIPRDLPSIVTQLEQHGMPSDVLNVLYNNYGIIPVRGPNHDVTAIEFNGKRYPIRPQPKTIIDIGGNHLVLPRDNDKLIQLISDRKVPVDEFLRVLQRAGYKLVPGPDGVLQSAHKGYEVINLPAGVRLVIGINGVKYAIPKDISRIGELLRTIRNGPAIDRLLDSLRLLGVDVNKSPNEVTLSFNGKRHTFPIHPQQPFESRGTGGTSGPAISVNFNGRWYGLPKDTTDLVTAVRAIGPQAITLLTKTLQSNGVQVKLTPNGDDIVSLVIMGQEIPVPSQSGYITGSRSAPEAFRVTIRGREFTVPGDIARLPRELPGFQYGELITALHRAGHKLEADDRGTFYGMRVHGGRLIRFPVRFRVNVMTEKNGRPFQVPRELAQLARVLSSRRWNWNAVRKTLANAGVEVKGGNDGAPRAIGFQGQFFQLHNDAVKGRY
ncbi:uncharacterized protein LOC144129207 [Amblyomma americanum]